jgi:hypothetical protein
MPVVIANPPMKSRTPVSRGAMKSPTDDRSVLHHNSTDGDLAPVAGLFGLAKRNPHPKSVILHHSL